MEETSVSPTFRIGPELNRLLFRNEVLELLTLRLYRFWSRTAMRRYLWSAISIDGEAVEYTGTARELLFSFLIVFSLLAVPLIAICGAADFFATDAAATAVLCNIYWAAYAFLLAAGSYLAMRYRLSCTLWRGIAGGLGGSAPAYGLRQLGWSVAFCLTAGMTTPWACADLARYQGRHIHWGDFTGRFHGSARGLLRHWLPVWALCFAPVYAAAVYSVAQSDWNIGALYIELASIFDLVNDYEDHHYLYAWVAIFMGCQVALYYFRLRRLEWFINSFFLGPMRFSCRVSHAFPPHVLRHFALLAAYAFAATYVIIRTNLGPGGLFADWSYIASVWGCLGLTMVAVAGGHFIWLRLIEVPLLQIILSHMQIENFAAAATARQSPRVAPRAAEGLWDVVHVSFI